MASLSFLTGRTVTIVMKLDNFVPFGRPQSGTVIIIQLMTDLDVSNNYIPEQQYQKPSRKQSNALFFSTKNRMSQCTYFDNT